MKSFHYSLRLFSLLAGALSVSCHVHAASKPNIIFITSDDHRWDCLGAAGNPNIHTPHLDRLATEGVYFTQATVHNPQCSPSRAVLLTGLASHANGRYSNQSARRDIWSADGFNQYICTPEALAAEGYHTALVGKWHLFPRPWKTGFEKIGTWMPGALGPFKNPPLAQGRELATTTTLGYTQELFGRSAREIIANHSERQSTRPLFLWLAFTAPHSPYKPNPESATKPYLGKAIKDVLPPSFKGDINQPDAKHWLEYVAAITSVDEEVGKLLITLDETGISSNTVVVFMGDNGYMMGSRGMNGKGEPWEESIRVPLIIWGPGIFKGKGKTTAAASSLDLPPTIARLAGAEPPAEWQGRDLNPVLADGHDHDITWSISEAPDYDNFKFPGVSYRTIRTSSSKLIVWHEKTGKAPELYDLATDPYEQRNVIKNPEFQLQGKSLQDTLDKWMAETGDNWEMRDVVPTGNYGRYPEDKGKQSSSD